MKRKSGLKEKKQRLIGILEACDGLAIAFSGGVDSSFLLAVAKDVLGGKVLAVTATSAIHSRAERLAAAEIARALGVTHRVAASREMDLPEFVANPSNRCYVCKRHVMAEVVRIAAEMGIAHVAHGVNVDDLGDFRPGLKAAEEMGLLAPLVEAGLTKADIRALSRRMGLGTWNKPSMACLASRIPYGTAITLENLRMVEEAEDFLRGRGFAGCRVRHHGAVARIELCQRDLKKALAAPARKAIVGRLRAIGFRYVAVDLEGYVMGSLNRTLEGEGSRVQGGEGSSEHNL
ncbi:MAG TPA: ATP-dependent sacrificial sulfur transferase LarE [Desulfobacterales bacterium]|nr:ATP-dependent sacrificial sulfur transferase LarE [Desulfobacterales bacterium]